MITTKTQEEVDSAEELRCRKSPLARALERARRQVAGLDRRIERLRGLGEDGSSSGDPHGSE